MVNSSQSTRHTDNSSHGQLVTKIWAVTSWPCDELTGTHAFASIQCSKLRLRPGLRPGPLLSGFKRADSRRGGGGSEGNRRKKKEGDGSLGRVGGRRRRERKERGRQMGRGGKLEQGRRLAKAGPDFSMKMKSFSSGICPSDPTRGSAPAPSPCYRLVLRSLARDP